VGVAGWTWSLHGIDVKKRFLRFFILVTFLHFLTFFIFRTFLHKNVENLLSVQANSEI